MAVTFNYEVNKKPNKRGKFSIFLRITQNQKHKKVKKSFELSRLSDWNGKTQRYRASEPNAAIWNPQLDEELEKVKRIYRSLEDNGSGSSTAVVRKIRGLDPVLPLLAYSRKIHQQLLQEGRLGSWQKYGTFINKMEGYLTNKRGIIEDVPFKEITPAFIDGFSLYLQSLDNHRIKGSKLHPNTIAKLQRVFRAIVNRSITIDGYIKPEQNPFRNYKIKEVVTAKDKLESSEIEALLALDLIPYSPRWHARNAFFFSFYCAGIRAGDLMQLRWCNISTDGRLQYQMGKNHKIKSIAIVQQAKQILLYYHTGSSRPYDYIFPYLNNTAKYAKAVTQEEKESMRTEVRQALYYDIHQKNVAINKLLVKLASEAGITKHISFHISRHSFAKQAKLAGTDNAMLKDMLAHSSLSTTERYMGEFDTEKEDAALQKIFSQPAAEKNEDDLLKQLQALPQEKLNSILSQLKTN